MSCFGFDIDIARTVAILQTIFAMSSWKGQILLVKNRWRGDKYSQRTDGGDTFGHCWTHSCSKNGIPADPCVLLLTDAHHIDKRCGSEVKDIPVFWKAVGDVSGTHSELLLSRTVLTDQFMSPQTS